MKPIGKIILGGLTMLVLVSTLYLYGSFLTGKISLEAGPGTAGLPPMMMFFSLNSMLIFGLMVWYFILIVTNRSMSSTQKLLWGVLLVFLNVFIMPILFFARVFPKGTAIHAGQAGLQKG